MKMSTPKAPKGKPKQKRAKPTPKVISKVTVFEEEVALDDVLQINEIFTDAQNSGVQRVKIILIREIDEDEVAVELASITDEAQRLLDKYEKLASDVIIAPSNQEFTTKYGLSTPHGIKDDIYEVRDYLEQLKPRKGSWR